MSQCKKFTPNIFHKSKCSNCFRQKEEHSAEALECNRASRSIARNGYLFVAPDWDFSVPLNRTKRWQRRWFVLYDDGELNYSVDEHPDTIPQGSVDMSKVLEVTGAEQVTGHPHSLALTSPDRVTFVKAASREDARWWAELLAVFPRRHKRNATFPGGRASPSLPQLGRSASPQPPRPRHLSVNGPSPRTNFETPPLKEERESPPKVDEAPEELHHRHRIRPGWLPERTAGVVIENAPPLLIRKDYISSGSPPTRDKLRGDDKAKARSDWRNERLRDIATALTDRSPESSLALPAEGLLNLKKGWLWLMNDQNEWMRRWIVLCCPTLNVYQDQDEHRVPDLCVELSTVINYSEVPSDSKYAFEILWAGPTLVLSAVTQGIRSNWMQALKKAAPISSSSVDSPITPKSFSSDEEYRTASEGGRRESGDWSSELPPSPPFSRFNRVRQRPRLPRSSQSRQSTLDSTSTDEIDCVKSSEVINDLQRQLQRSTDDVKNLEEEISKLKKLQSDVLSREKHAKEMLKNFEKIEEEFNQRNSKFIKEQKILQKRLMESEEASKEFQRKYEYLLREVQTKQTLLNSLQEELNNSNEKLQKTVYKNRVDSLTDLTNIDLEVDIDDLGTNELKEYCLDLKCRFEKAVIEIRAIKRVLHSSEDNVDRLQLTNHSLNQSIDMLKDEHQAEVNLLIARLDNLTSKLNTVEKQLRYKASKRRSLSLKGRESLSISKEVEDKVIELEAKIALMDNSKKRHSRYKSVERSSPIDDKSLRRLRRKSLDSATSSEPMKLLMRLSTLETKVLNASSESLVDVDEISFDNMIKIAKSKVLECLHSVSLLKNRRSSSTDRLNFLEITLKDLNDILSNREFEVATLSADQVVKQLQNQLTEKLNSLAEKKCYLIASGQYDAKARLEILAEKFAFENILIERIQEALVNTQQSNNGETISQKLIEKETNEATSLIINLQNKLNGTNLKSNQLGVESLTKVLAKCLISIGHGCKIKNFLNKNNNSSIKFLIDEQKKLTLLMQMYKSKKLPILIEEIDIEQFKTVTMKIANFELIQNEINHILHRAAQNFNSQFHGDDQYFFSFFAAERAGLEIWTEEVNQLLHNEIDKTVEELSELYKNKLEKQNWRSRLESERANKGLTKILQEYADIVAHKALIDAKINVLSGKVKSFDLQSNESDYLQHFVQDIDYNTESEFGCMLERYSRDCVATLDQPELDNVRGCLEEIQLKIDNLQCLVNLPKDDDDDDNCSDLVVVNWNDVCQKCKKLRSNLDAIQKSLEKLPQKSNNNYSDQRPVYLGTEYITQVENLRAAYRCTLAACKERHQESDIEHLQQLCEKVLLAMEQWHRRAIQELREGHAEEVEILKQEKEQALAEETQATLAALDAMRKAHVAEVQREVARFKQEFARQQRDEIIDLSERLSVKSLEAAALEEQLGSATRQLAHAQQHILQLERNPQLSSMQN